MPDVQAGRVTLKAPARATAGGCRVIVPLSAGTADALAPLAKEAAPRADILEVRLDALAPLTAEHAAAALDAVGAAAPGVPLLATVRTAREGGPADLCPGKYAALLTELCGLRPGGFRLLDVEFSAGEQLCADLLTAAHKAGAAAVFSRHDFARTPSVAEMACTLLAMADAGADVAKLAVMPAEGPADAARLLEATARAAALRPETPLITMSMGAAGAVSRVCGGAFGVCASFGAVGGAASAPGQPDAGALRSALTALDKAL